MKQSQHVQKGLFLRKQELRKSIELLFFAYRDFTKEADEILSQLGLGRAHHRVIYFVGRKPGMTVSELLSILKITKQSLSRVLSHLLEEEYITQRPGERDKRQRLLSLTPKGVELEARLTGCRRAKAYADQALMPNAFQDIRNMLNDDEHADEIKGHLMATQPIFW